MGSNKHGFANEIEIIEYLNDKTVFELNNNMKKFIAFLFGHVSDNSVISCKKTIPSIKPDISIKIADVTKYVSVKEGTGNSVHQERISLFSEFLIENGVEDTIIRKILFFHFGDDTTDGSGETRISSVECKKKYASWIVEINAIFNGVLLEPLLDRILFVGKNSEYQSADAIYHGSINEGNWINRNELISYVRSSNSVAYGIHVGPLTYQGWNRCLNHNPKTENRRFVVQFKWGLMKKMFYEIERMRNSE